MEAKTLFVVLMVSIICISSTFASNILCLFASNGQSHLIINMAIARTLANRGHNVTVVTTLPLKDENPKYNHIFLPPDKEDSDEYRKILGTAVTGTTWWDSTKLLFWANVQRARIQDKAISSPRFQELLHNPGNHFDAVILGIVFNTYQIGVAAHFKCPVILTWINQPPRDILNYVGSPWAIASVPTVYFASYDLRNFRNRLRNFLGGAFIVAIEEFSEYKMAQYYDYHFPGDRYPSFDEMKKNISLVFCASHFSEGKIRPLTPGFIEIGGIQVKDKPDPLPKDIEDFLKDDNEGFVLFSLGTNVKTTDLSSNATSAMFKVLSQSKYKILWKWDSTNTPGKSSNILFRKWFPQDDLLAHPKLKLFITHAGKGSSVEAQYHGVPMLAIPVYADQFSNAKELTDMGYGLEINHRNVTEESFRKDFYEILDNPRYSKAISKFSKLYRDRPLSARESVIYWTEYVIRHRGAKHMQNLRVQMNIFQKHSLDVVAFLGIILYLFYWVLRGLLRISKMMLGIILKRKLKFE